MRWRWWLGLTAVLFLLGCLNIETRVQVFQDGSGLYTERVEIKTELMKLAFSPGFASSYEDVLVEAADKALQELEGVAGVRLLDMQGDWQTGETLKITAVYAFESVEHWNRFADVAKKPKIAFTAKEGKRKGKKPAETTWTMGFETSAEALTNKAQPGGSGDDKAAAETLLGASGLQVGTFRLTLAGPARATTVKTLVENKDIQASIAEDGGALFTGPLNVVLNKPTFEAQFVGQALAEAALATAKKAAWIEPSAQYRQVLERVAQRREEENTKEAATQAITQTRFELRLQITKDGKVKVQTTRAYYGPTATLFAGREAMLHSLIPEATGNYQLEVKTLKNADGRPGLAFGRTRVDELPIGRLAEWMGVRRDGVDTIYEFQLARLLTTELIPPQNALALGTLVVTTPEPISGTNGTKLGDREVSLDLSAAALAGRAALIIRTTPGK